MFGQGSLSIIFQDLRVARTQDFRSKSNMSGRQLPNNVWSVVIQEYLLEPTSTLSDGLALRQINSWFNDEVLCSLFVLQIKDLRNTVRYKRVPRHIGLLQLQGFFGKRKLPVKSHKLARKTILRTFGYDTHDPALFNSCFHYRPGDVCPSKLVGSSSSSVCEIHDILNAITSAFGSLAFALGCDGEEYEISCSRDKRYWMLLKSCYKSEISQVKYYVQELISDKSIEKDTLAAMICDCFLIATRENAPLLIDVLHEETKDCEEVLTKLGRRSSVANALLESIRLGRCEVFEKLLKWQWKFNNSNWSYVRIVKLIMNDDTYPKRDKTTQEKLLRTMFEWTDTWRNISEMKEFLMRVGEKDQQHFLEVAVETLKSQHFFRHERGSEGSFYPSQPLANLAQNGNIELVKLYLDNRNILLPHTDEEKDRDMRRLVLSKELERNSEARVDLMKLLIDHSQDLVDSKHELQTMLISQYDSKLDTWAWLAKKVGLDSACKDLTQHTLGSAMLERAVEKLNVETVRFLVGNGIQLVAEASTIQVYDDDEEMMKRLDTIKTLLARGGQGEFKERKILETTFTPLKISNTRPKRAEVAPKSHAGIKISTASAAAKAAYHPACPRFLKKSFSIASRKHNSKKSRKTLSMNSVSSGSELGDQSLNSSLAIAS